ncbi:MAG: GYF domain-containing protein [Bacteriovoracia bacterium]
MEDKSWYLYIVDHHEGPFTVDEIQNLVSTGEARTSSYVWKSGLADWMMLSDVKDFKEQNQKTRKLKAVPAPVTPTTVQVVENSGPDLSGVSPGSAVWCLSSKEGFSGPHTMKAIQFKLTNGEISPSNKVWKEGWTNFVAIDDIPQFMVALSGESRPTKEPFFAKIKAGIESRISALFKKSPKPVANLKASPYSQASFKGGRKTWYKSPIFVTFFIFLVLLSFYQFLATGMLNPIVEKTPLKGKIPELVPLKTEVAFEAMLSAKEKLAPLYHTAIEKIIPFVPQNVQDFLMPAKIPTTIQPADIEIFKDVVQSPSSTGIRIATALPIGREVNPSFYLATNRPNATSFYLVLKGKEGTLVGALTYERAMIVETVNHIGKTPVFTFDNNRAMPIGEYSLFVYKNKEDTKPISIDAYFLGGKKDEAYQTQLKGSNERLKRKILSEGRELDQLLSTIESMANESASKFFDFTNGIMNPLKKKGWKQYSARYQQMAKQIEMVFSKLTPDVLRKDYVYPDLYEKVKTAFEETQKLHQIEGDIIEKGSGKISTDVIQTYAQKTSAVLVETRQSLGKIKKL